MATSAVSSAPSAGAILSSVGALQQSIQAAAGRVQAQKSGTGDASSSSAQTSKAPEIQEFRKDVRKSPYKTANAATDIGILVKNSSRLNVISSLGAKDTADFYKFKVTTGGEMTLGQVGDESLRVQVMTKLGAVVADSNVKSGTLNENFKKMQDGKFAIERGDYVIRVSREAASGPAKAQNYAVQLRMGSYNRDFDTVAQASRPSDAIPQQSVGMQKLQDMLNSGTSFIQSLPAIGTPATQKLLGTVFSTSA